MSEINELKIKQIMANRAEIDLAMKDLNYLESIAKQLDSVGEEDIEGITFTTVHPATKRVREIEFLAKTYPNPLYSHREVEENRKTIQQLVDLFWAITHARIKDRCEAIQKMTT